MTTGTRGAAIAGVALVLAATGRLRDPSGGAGPERVTFDSLDRDPATGDPVRITALLFRPKGAGDARLPAVVALHGCGGMYSTLPSRQRRSCRCGIGRWRSC